MIHDTWYMIHEIHDTWYMIHDWDTNSLYLLNLRDFKTILFLLSIFKIVKKKFSFYSQFLRFCSLFLFQWEMLHILERSMHSPGPEVGWQTGTAIAIGVWGVYFMSEKDHFWSKSKSLSAPDATCNSAPCWEKSIVFRKRSPTTPQTDGIYICCVLSPLLKNYQCWAIFIVCAFSQI